MELLQLRYFLVAARYEHMTHAAEQLHIAQPALTQSIQRLEAELGMPLFDRKSRGISLNDSGRLLQKKAVSDSCGTGQPAGRTAGGQRFFQSHDSPQYAGRFHHGDQVHHCL